MPNAELDKWHDVEKRCYISKRARSICFAESDIFLFLKRVVIPDGFISFFFCRSFTTIEVVTYTGKTLMWALIKF